MPGWGRLELAAAILVPSCLLCVGAMLGVCVLQGPRCAYRRAHKQDAEEALDDHTLMTPDKCLKELIYDMSSSGSGSGDNTHTRKHTHARKHTQTHTHIQCASLFFIVYAHVETQEEGDHQAS